MHADYIIVVVVISHYYTNVNVVVSVVSASMTLKYQLRQCRIFTGIKERPTVATRNFRHHSLYHVSDITYSQKFSFMCRDIYYQLPSGSLVQWLAYPTSVRRLLFSLNWDRGSIPAWFNHFYLSVKFLLFFFWACVCFSISIETFMPVDI